MAKKLSKEQADELRKVFDTIDTNKNGKVEKEELMKMLNNLGEDVTEDVVNEMIKIADTNQDGMIDFEEFVKATSEGNLL